MSHGPTHYPAKNYCIYCGAVGIRLTDEHIIPLSLGGAHVLKKASCDSCSKITSKFELKVARGLWGQARLSYNAPSRRKARKSSFVLTRDSANPETMHSVLSSDFPATLVFYKMGTAGILNGIDKKFDLSVFWKLFAIGDKDRPDSFERKYGFKPTMSFSHQPQEFGQLLLKIGYGQILTQVDRHDFEPLCLPYILGQEQNVSWLVGSDENSHQPLDKIGYSMRTSALLESDSMLLLAHLKLWANLEMPWYHMVIGRVLGEDKIADVISKIGENQELRWEPVSELNAPSFSSLQKNP
jgi:HNH endonuclease